MFILMLLLGHHTTQEQGAKKDAVGLVGFGSVKIILILLTKAVTVQVKISIIRFGEPGLQRLFLMLCLD